MSLTGQVKNLSWRKHNCNAIVTLNKINSDSLILADTQAGFRFSWLSLCISLIFSCASLHLWKSWSPDPGFLIPGSVLFLLPHAASEPPYSCLNTAPPWHPVRPHGSMATWGCHLKQTTEKHFEIIWSPSRVLFMADSLTLGWEKVNSHPLELRPSGRIPAICCRSGVPKLFALGLLYSLENHWGPQRVFAYMVVSVDVCLLILEMKVRDL